MFTVKVREESRIASSNEHPPTTELNETLLEARSVLVQQGNIIVNLVEPNWCGDEQITYTPVRPRVEGYSGKIYVMNRYGATVATYDL